MKAILGEKLGMTQVFDEESRAIPVTVIKAGPCHVVQVKTPESDGYGAVQIAYREIEENGYIYPVIKIGVTYYSPLYYDEAICIHTRPAVLERVRLQFDYVITHEQTHEIICKGFTRHCAVNASGIPVEVDGKTAHLWRIFPK